MSEPTTIAFVRHGQVHNPDDIFYGRLARFRLSEEGVRQAEAARRWLADKPVAAVYSSPLLRARQTAEIILESHPDLQLRISRLIMEVHTPFDGQPRQVLTERKWDLYTDVPEEYEQPSHVVKRMRRFVEQTLHRHAGEYVVAVTHSDPILFLVLWANEVAAKVGNKREFASLGLGTTHPANASISIFVFDPDRPDALPEFSYVNPWLIGA